MKEFIKIPREENAISLKDSHLHSGNDVKHKAAGNNLIENGRDLRFKMSANCFIK